MYKILLTTAGSGNSMNIVRSLKNTNRTVCFIGANIDKFELAKSNCDKNYLVPPFDRENYCETIENIIEKEEIDFMIPNHEMEIQSIRKSNSKKILEKCFIPSLYTINLCVDKFKLIDFLRQNNFIDNTPESYMLKEYNDILFKEFNFDFPMWIRLVRGGGSRGATLVHSREELRFWVEYWVKHKHVDVQDFMVSEYLPGEDHHYFSLWKDGEMIIGKAIQRLKYCCSKYTLTGTSSSPSLCKLVSNSDLDNLSENIVKTVDKDANGLFGIDYKQNENGNHCLTEINIGRFPRINYIFNLAKEPNIAEYYMYCGLKKEFINPKKFNDSNDEWFLFRDFDLGLKLKHKKDIENYSII